MQNTALLALGISVIADPAGGADRLSGRTQFLLYGVLLGPLGVIALLAPVDAAAGVDSICATRPW